MRSPVESKGPWAVACTRKSIGSASTLFHRVAGLYLRAAESPDPTAQTGVEKPVRINR